MYEKIPQRPGTALFPRQKSGNTRMKTTNLEHQVTIMKCTHPTPSHPPPLTDSECHQATPNNTMY